jgi:hypothetical protein
MPVIGGRSMSTLSLARRLRRRLGVSLEPFDPLPPRSRAANALARLERLADGRLPAPRTGSAALRYDRLALAIRTAEAQALTALDRMGSQGMKVIARQQHKPDHEPDPDPSSAA